jgi:hypothetical protein
MAIIIALASCSCWWYLEYESSVSMYLGKYLFLVISGN